jgi:hypothetical protein
MSDDPPQPGEAAQPGEPIEPVDGFDEELDFEPEDADDAFTTADFHNVVRKQIINASYETLLATKMDWELVEPFLIAARNVCRGDFRRTGRVQIHAVTGEGDALVPAEEAFVGLSVADQDNGSEWLSETWWLSDLVLAGADPAQVREAVGALERSIAKLNAWLEQEKGPGETE